MADSTLQEWPRQGMSAQKGALDIESLQCISICSPKACLLLSTKATLASGSPLIVDPEHDVDASLTHLQHQQVEHECRVGTTPPR